MIKKIGINKFEFYFILILGFSLGLLNKGFILISFLFFIGTIAPIIDYKIIWKYQYGNNSKKRKIIENFTLKDVFLLHIPLILSLIFGFIMGVIIK